MHHRWPSAHKSKKQILFVYCASRRLDLMSVINGLEKQMGGFQYGARSLGSSEGT
jgi:hypothetical protein